MTSMTKAVELTEPNVVFVASPNNPTGNRMSDDRVEALLEAARGALVIVDEAYADFAGSTVRGWRARHPNLAILRTLSKLGLAALRIGWLEGPREIVAAIDKVRQPFNVSATSQAAAAAVMRDTWSTVLEHVGEVRRERDRIVAEMRTIEGVTPLPTDANFVWVRTDKPAGDVHAGLLARGVLVRSFHAVGGRLGAHLRVTVGTPAENDALLEALRGVA
jgi:histidinol-phosphate aminotransferase